MNTVFAIKNQHGFYLNKHQEWVDGRDSQSLFRTAHKDEAINTVFEMSSRDIHVRAEVIACVTDEKGNPLTETIAAAPTIALESTPDTQSA
jgi:hypothetical protein